MDYNRFWSPAFDNTDDFICLIDNDYNLVRVNKSFSKFFGKSENELIGKKYFEIFHSSDKPFPGCPHEKMLSTKVYEKADYYEPYLKKYLSVTAIPIWGDDGKLAGSIHITKDVTELRQTEDALQESKEKYQKIVENSTDCVYLLNNKGCLIYANRCALMMNEITDSKSFIGMPFIDLIATRYKKLILNSIKASLSGEQMQFRYMTVAPNKKHKWWSAAFLPIRDAKGHVVSILNISRDMTMERESKAREEFFKEYAENILANVPISVLVVNRSGQIIFANRNFLSKMKVNESNVVGRPLAKIVPEDILDKANLRHQIADSLKTRDVIAGQKFEYRGRNFLYHLIPMKEVAGRRHNVAIMMEDVTERAALEEQLRHSEKLAMMGQFAAGVTHEINNPLAIIKGNVQYLRDQIKKGVDFHTKGSFKELKDTLAAVEHEAARCANIISELLHFASKSGAKQKGNVDINHLVRHVLHLMKRQLNLRKIKVAYELAGASPSVHGNEELLQQVIINLMLNAEQAIGKRGGLITIKTLQDRRKVYIIVKDSGCGIPKEMQRFIFNPFFTTKGSGTGLGLSVAHSIVEDHGGTITVRSQPKRGSVFTVTLPIRNA